MVQEKPAEEILSGYQWVRTTGTPISLNTAPAGGAAIPLGCREVFVQADPDNVNVVAVGAINCAVGPPSIGGQLAPGASRVLAIDDVSKLFVNGTTPDAVIWDALR